MKRCWLLIGLLCCSGAALAQTETKLTAADNAAGDWFGGSASLDGDTAVIGAPFDDDDGSASGSAYVFVRDTGGSWSQQAKLTASDGGSGDNLGISVSVNGDTAVAGAWMDDSGAGSDSGSAYVFVRDVGGTWTQQAKLTAADAAGGDGFGIAVSVYGDTVIVGSYNDTDGGTGSGSAYVFTRDAGGSWTQQAKLTASDAAAGDNFGVSVSFDGGTAVIGAWRDDHSGAADTGSAYVFISDAGGTWTQQAKLTASDPGFNDGFGYAVSVDAGTAVIGAIFKNNHAGSAYVFTRNAGGVWSQQVKLPSGGPDPGDELGWSTSVKGDTAVIGAHWDNDGGTCSGSAYVYRRSGSSWTLQVELHASDAAIGDEFGYAVSVDGSTAVIGAAFEGNNTGSAYVFTGAPIPVELQHFSVE